MKNLYITMLALAISGYAGAQEKSAKSEVVQSSQQNQHNNSNIADHPQDDKDAVVASERGIKYEPTTKQDAHHSAGRIYDGTGSEIEFIRSTMPGYKKPQPTIATPTKEVKGLIATKELTFEEIRATIPKN